MDLGLGDARVDADHDVAPLRGGEIETVPPGPQRRHHADAVAPAQSRLTQPLQQPLAGLPDAAIADLLPAAVCVLVDGEDLVSAPAEAAVQHFLYGELSGKQGTIVQFFLTSFSFSP